MSAHTQLKVYRRFDWFLSISVYGRFLFTLPGIKAAIISSLLENVYYYFLRFTLCKVLCVLCSMMNFKTMVNRFSSYCVTSYIWNGSRIPGNIWKCGATIICLLLILLPFLWFCNRSLIFTRNTKWPIKSRRHMEAEITASGGPSPPPMKVECLLNWSLSWPKWHDQNVVLLLLIFPVASTWASLQASGSHGLAYSIWRVCCWLIK